MGLTAGILGAAAILAGTGAGMQAKEAHDQRKLAKQQQEEQERLAKLEAGKAPTNIENTGVADSNETRQSAIRRTILTRTQQAGSKLGD